MDTEPREENEGLCTFKVIVERDGTQRIVALGEADLSVAEELGTTMFRALDARTGPVLVDCAGLRYLDSSGIRELLRAQAAAVQLDLTFGVVNPSPNVRQVLELTDVATLIIEPS
jgi:anti-sigma B factor antagonist